MQTNFNLQALNTFKIAAQAEHYLAFSSIDELMSKLTAFEQQQSESSIENKADKYFILGGGSNVLLSDIIPGVTLHCKDESINVKAISSKEVELTVGAGKNWDDLVKFTVKKGFAGLECLTLIPGNVGASPVQNIGAYGAEVSEHIVEVRCFNLDTRQIEILNNTQCQFDYRMSVFKLRPELLVVSVTFKLISKSTVARYLPNFKDGFAFIRLLAQSLRLNKQTGYKPKMHFDKVRAILALPSLPIRLKRSLVKFIRQRTMPDPKVVANVGCFFKSPIIDKTKVESVLARFVDTQRTVATYPYSETHLKVSAGDLIKAAELNGVTHGNVRIDKNRPLILISNGKATGAEILDFAKYVQQTVADVTSIKIEPEVVILEAQK